MTSRRLAGAPGRLQPSLASSAASRAPRLAPRLTLPPWPWAEPPTGGAALARPALALAFASSPDLVASRSPSPPVGDAFGRPTRARLIVPQHWHHARGDFPPPQPSVARACALYGVLAPTSSAFCCAALAICASASAFCCASLAAAASVSAFCLAAVAAAASVSALLCRLGAAALLVPSPAPPYRAASLSLTQPRLWRLGLVLGLWRCRRRHLAFAAVLASAASASALCCAALALAASTSALCCRLGLSRPPRPSAALPEADASASALSRPAAADIVSTLPPPPPLWLRPPAACVAAMASNLADAACTCAYCLCLGRCGTRLCLSHLLGRFGRRYVRLTLLPRVPGPGRIRLGQFRPLHRGRSTGSTACTCSSCCPDSSTSTVGRQTSPRTAAAHEYKSQRGRSGAVAPWPGKR